MHSAMNLLKVLVLLLVATAILGLTMALFTAETGMAEKVVLLGLMGACAYVAARAPTFMGSLEAKLDRSRLGHMGWPYSPCGSSERPLMLATREGS